MDTYRYFCVSLQIGDGRRDEQEMVGVK